MPTQKQERRKGRFVKQLLIDERVVIFIRFHYKTPNLEILNRIGWAKSWVVDSFSTDIIIRCYVKPWYVKHFIKENKDNRLWFSYDKLGELSFFSVKTSDNSTSCYEE